MSRTKLEMEATYAEVEEYLVRVRSHFKVKQILGTKYGVTPSTVSRWITEVHRRWAETSKATDKEQRRDEMRALLDKITELAMNRQVPARGDDGKILKDDKGKVVMRVSPDLQHALHAAAQIRAMDGLDVAPPLRVKVEGGDKPVQHVVGHAVVTKDEASALARILKGLPKKP